MSVNWKNFVVLSAQLHVLRRCFIAFLGFSKMLYLLKNESLYTRECVNKLRGRDSSHISVAISLRYQTSELHFGKN